MTAMPTIRLNSRTRDSNERAPIKPQTGHNRLTKLDNLMDSVWPADAGKLSIATINVNVIKSESVNGST